MYPEALVEFAVQQIEGVPVVQVRGEIDMSNAKQLTKAIEGAADEADGALIVSLGEVSYFDSQGVDVLVRIAERFDANRRRLILVAPQGAGPRRILTLAGLPDVIPIFDSVPEALSHSRAEH